jgi:hypothetical protein
MTIALSLCLLAAGVASPPALDIAGSYTLVGDSDGTVPKKGAVITLTLGGDARGSMTVLGTQPGQTVSDSGTYSARGGRITMRFLEMEWRVENQPFQFDGCTLTLPFKALSGTPGPGTSTWLKKHPSCERKQLGSTRQALTDEGGGIGDSGQGASPRGAPPDPPPPAGGEGTPKESCEQCKYLKCLESLIAQKKAIVAALKEIAAERGWGDLAKDGNDYADLRGASPEAANFTVDSLDKDRSDLESEAYGGLDASLASAISEYCSFSGSGVVTIRTDPLTCQIDDEDIARLRQAVPCQEIFDFMFLHESSHVMRCRERKQRGLVAVPTARGEAREDVAAYAEEIASLTQIVRRLKARCLWLCRCDQGRHASKAACLNVCKARMDCVQPPCVPLDPKTQGWIAKPQDFGP